MSAVETFLLREAFGTDMVAKFIYELTVEHVEHGDMYHGFVNFFSAYNSSEMAHSKPEAAQCLW